jgi:hypothetical protein
MRSNNADKISYIPGNGLPSKTMTFVKRTECSITRTETQV